MDSRLITLPVGAVVPTFNCRPYLPMHLASMREWADRVEEIVVVDSFSSDGTVEFLREHLNFPNVRFLSHPRGLYESWNFGVSGVRAKYTYFSTVGDSITPAGLEHLVEVAEKFRADVTVSPPRSVGPDGRTLKTIRWPVDDLINWWAITAPAAVSSLHAFLMSAMPMSEGILGSSASNLYRTELLKRCPFPTHCGHAGDTAWSLQYGLQSRFAVTPAVVSQFLIHPKDFSIGDEERVRLFELFFDIGLKACRESDPGGLLPFLENLRAETAQLRARQRAYDRLRKHRFPWVLNPQAWSLRSRRNQQRQVVAAMKSRICAQFGVQPRGTAQ